MRSFAMAPRDVKLRDQIQVIELESQINISTPLAVSSLGWDESGRWPLRPDSRWQEEAFDQGRAFEPGGSGGLVGHRRIGGNMFWF